MRCSCLVELVVDERARSARVMVVDPECGYVVHRWGAELVDADR